MIQAYCFAGECSELPLRGPEHGKKSRPPLPKERAVCVHQKPHGTFGVTGSFGAFVGPRVASTPHAGVRAALAILADLSITTPHRKIEVPATAFPSARPGHQAFEF